MKTLAFILKKIDHRFGTFFYQFSRKVYYKIENFYHAIWRIIDRFRLVYYGWHYKGRAIKLHLGCGEQHKEECVNIDWRRTKATDYVCNIRSIPFPSNSVVSIESYHVIEHLSQKDAIQTLREWYRILEVGGRIIIECPNFDKAIEEYLAGNNERIFNIFGYHRFSGDAHLFGYNSKRLGEVLDSIGFSEITELEPKDYHTLEEPCIRMEAIKISHR